MRYIVFGIIVFIYLIICFFLMACFKIARKTDEVAEKDYKERFKGKNSDEEI